jgi:iron complex outermembrane recepter protein
MQRKYTLLRLVALTVLALPGAALAQATPAEQTPTNPAPTAATADATPTEAARKATEEEITVTGSRVRRKDLTTPAPVTVINREQITSSGIASLGDFLQQMPEQGGALNTNVNNGGDGETAISLRNLGAQRTLVLVDGKRWVNGGSGAGSFVDLNSIPSAAVERVEVLKDGASAVYGSDAIGGVVNIITRRRVNGVEFSGYAGESPQGDARQYDLSVTGGAASDRGSFMFTAGYFDQKPMFAGNRDWAARALTYHYDTGKVTQGGSPTIPAGRAAVNLNACNGNALCARLQSAFASALKCPASGTCRKTFIHDTTSPACAAGFTATPTTDFTSCQIGGWRPMVGTALNAQNGPTNDLYNFQAVNYLITPSTRIQLFSNGDYNVSNVARAYFQGSFVNRQSEFKLAPEPLSTGAFGARLNVDNHFNPFGVGDVSTPSGCVGRSGAEVDSAGNPIPLPAGCGQGVTASRRLLDAGGRSSGFDISTIRAVAGIDGTLPDTFGPLQGVYWDLSFNYGRTYGTTTVNGSVNTAQTAQALGSTNAGGTGCGSANNPIGGCTPADLFAPQGGVTPAMLASMGIYSGVNSGFTQQTAVQANVSAELIKLFAERPIGIAAGYEYRNEFGGFTPDPIGAAGNSFDFNSLPTKGSYHVNEGYAELDMPLVSAMPYVDDLEVQAAARVFNYSTFGSDWTYKLGLRYRPIRDVTLRGTWGTGFRAPSISDLFGGAGPSAEPAVDPCAPTTSNVIAPGRTAANPGTVLGNRCNAVVNRQGQPAGTVVAGNGDPSQQINSTIGGNAALQPEKAEIGTIGIVFEPRIIRNFSATLDYYNIKVTQNLGNIGTPVILRGCYSSSNDAYCDLITRGSDGTITNVNDATTNVGSLQTSGIDFALRYALPTDYGRFTFLFDSTYLIYIRQKLGDLSVISSAGNYDLGSGTAVGNLTPKVKFNAGVNYALAGFSAGVRVRYIGAFDECAGSDGSSASAGLCTIPTGPDGLIIAQSPFASRQVPSYTTVDLLASYLLRNPFGRTTISVGVRNLFDKNPPYVFNETFIFTDPGYDLVGRFIYGRVQHTF